MTKEMEDFFEELEMAVESGGGQIYVGGQLQDVNPEEAEAALLYMSMIETHKIKRAMKDINYFWEIVELGMEEMGLDEESKPKNKKLDKKTFKQFVKEINET